MADEQAMPLDTATLLARLQQARTALEAAVGRLSEADLSRPGPDGWSAKDHLAHITVWERSLTALLSGQSRAAAMGVDEATFQGGFDRINAAVQARERDRPAAAVLADFHASHQAVLAALAPLTDADLAKSYDHYQPGAPGRRGHEPIIGWIVGNTYEHYEEHAATIAALAATPPA